MYFELRVNVKNAKEAWVYGDNLFTLKTVYKSYGGFKRGDEL